MDKTLYIYQASAGTGKTFTLAAYYISLLMRGENYRSIMAVTFTNKATAEMKDRIMNHLYWMSQGMEEASFVEKVRDFMTDWYGEGHAIPDAEQMKPIAGEVFQRMMQDYDGVKVTTIDSFLQTLMSGLAHTLGNAAGYSVDLDSDRAISDAITQLLSTHITMHEGLQQTLMEYIRDRISDESGWDIRNTLTKLAQELFKEAVQKSEQEDKINFDRDAIQAFRKNIQWNKLKEIAALHEMVKNTPDQSEKISYAKAFNKWKNSLLEKPAKEDSAYKEPGSNVMKFIHAQAPTFNDLVDAAEKARRAYITWSYTMKHLADMMLLGYIRSQIDSNQGESNSVLLAKTASILSEALRPGDADFILEKAGLRYRHILLDEFQDTSTQQWNCFLPLVHEILSNGGTAFIVGDTKQGIYRWRNGDWTIMTGLENDDRIGAYAQPRSLTDNYRCHKKVIEMVDLFEYKDKGIKEGGSVRVRIYPYSFKKKEGFPSHDQARQQILEDMFTQIETLLRDKTAVAKNCMILIRGHKDSKRVMDAFRRADRNRYPLLCKAGITSADSLLLESSRSVQVVMNALRYCEMRDAVGLKYVALVTGDEVEILAQRLQKVDRSMPLNALVEQIISTCLCPDDKFVGTDLAYLDCFRDKVADYIHNKCGSVADFIRYWDDIMHKAPISAPESEQVKMLTIHSAKGLESKQLFIPFCNWERVTSDRKKSLIWCDCRVPQEGAVSPLKKVPISFQHVLKDSAYAGDYTEERDAQYKDNDNLLYVALTRAAVNLFVWADMDISTDETKQKPNEDQMVSILADRLGMWDEVCKAYNGYKDQPEGSECYVQYPEDWKVFIPKKKAENGLPEPFSFADDKNAEALQEVAVQSYAQNDAICFRMSNDSDKADFGTMCHDILADMVTREDEDTAIRRAIEKGLMTSDDEGRVRETIDRAWGNEQMCAWFTDAYTPLREQALLTTTNIEKPVQRPDRVMVKGSTAIVLDYKFGKMSRHYFRQVHEYMQLMRDLGYTDVSGYLWMAESGQLIPVE